MSVETMASPSSRPAADSMRILSTSSISSDGPLSPLSDTQTLSQLPPLPQPSSSDPDKDKDKTSLTTPSKPRPLSSSRPSSRRKKSKKKPIIEDPEFIRHVALLVEKNGVASLRTLLAGESSEHQIDFTKGGFQALLIAVSRGYVDVLTVIIDEFAAKFHSTIQINLHNGVAIQRAVIFKQRETVKYLITHPNLKCSVNERSLFYGVTPLMLACQHGHKDIAYDLITLGGAIVNDSNNREKNGFASGFTPLHYAADGGHTAICEMLIDNGAHIDPWCVNGASPMLIAAEKGHWETVKMFITRGSNIHNTRRGLNAVQWAIYRANVDMVQYLVSYGGVPDVSVKTKWFPMGKTLVEVIAEEFSEALLQGIDTAIYRGKGLVLDRERRRKILSEVQWEYHPPFDPYSFDPRPPPTIRTFPDHVVAIIAQYD